jgi:hypothetical protein
MSNQRVRVTPEELSIINQVRQIGLNEAVKRLNNENKDKGYRFEQKGENAEVEFKHNARISSLKELVEACQIDLREWKIERWVCNKWEVGAKDGNDVIQVTPLFQVKVWLKPNQNAVQLKSLRDELIEDLRKNAPVVAPIEYVKTDAGRMAQINIFDAHIDKLAWHEEVGENYDLKIALNRFNTAVNELIRKAQVFSIERILLPVGNDFFNTDNSENTTKRGTRQDVDVRGKNSFRKGVQLLRDNIDRLSVIAPVDIVVVPGNHDEEKTWYLGEVLEAIYSNNPNVNVDNSPRKRKYFSYGKNLIGLTHGDKEKVNDLPSIMSSEVPQLYANAVYREWHLGHVHHQKVKDYIGCTVRYMRSISGTDVWHFDSGYVGVPKSAECFIWKAEGGIEGMFYETFFLPKQ